MSLLLLVVEVGESGCAVGLEHIRELNDQAIKNVNKDHSDLLATERMRLIGKIAL